MEIRIILCISPPVHALGNYWTGYLAITIVCMIYRCRDPHFASMCCNYAITLAYIYWVMSRTIWGSDIECQNMPAAGYIYC
ncbi:hypothetical protein K438DRAFT_342992 [Mycena galopus ATCC 62051]|nr:hypothetical protein K438DRAFT_342992 [Mycena galopus ATCC 62051]